MSPEPPGIPRIRDAAVAGFAAGEMSMSIALARMRLNSGQSVCSLQVGIPSTDGTPLPAIESVSPKHFAKRLSVRRSRESIDASAGVPPRRGSLREERRKNSVRRSDAELIGMAASGVRRSSLLTAAPVVMMSDVPEMSQDDLIGAMFDAVAEGDSELVDELIAMKVPINVPDGDGNTPLLLAAEGEPQIVQALISAGSDVNHQNSEGLTALMRAISCARARREPPVSSISDRSRGPCTRAHACSSLRRARGRARTHAELRVCRGVCMAQTRMRTSSGSCWPQART